MARLSLVGLWAEAIRRKTKARIKMQFVDTLPKATWSVGVFVSQDIADPVGIPVNDIQHHPDRLLESSAHRTRRINHKLPEAL